MGLAERGSLADACFDEAYAAPGEPRPHYAGVLRNDFAELAHALERRVTAAGLTFGGDRFALDPVPRVIPNDDWELLEAGIAQRTAALNAFVLDVYGPRRIVAAGLVPSHVITSADHYEPAVAEIDLPSTPIVVAGLDIVREPSGEYLVLEDNTRTPSGLTYALAARELLDELLHDLPPRRRPHVALEALAGALDGAVILSDGPENAAYFEHCTIADGLGLPLVQPHELESDASGVRLAGGGERVDVIYRRTNEDRLFEPDGTPTGMAELLLEPLQAGTVRVANAFGTGVADDKLTHAYVERMVRFYLGEEPLLRSVPTYDMRDDEQRDAVLGRLGDVVTKPRAGSGGEGVLIGPLAGDEELERRAAEIEADPATWIAQEIVWLSRHPTVVEDRLEPRHIDLRVFAICVGDSVTVMPGGLTRVAMREGEMIVNSSQEGGAKDTWVLA